MKFSPLLAKFLSQLKVNTQIHLRSKQYAPKQYSFILFLGTRACTLNHSVKNILYIVVVQQTDLLSGLSLPVPAVFVKTDSTNPGGKKACIQNIKQAFRGLTK
jgi:hypothetical protein